MFENEWFPKANAIGVSWREFWEMNPHIINLLIKGHHEKIKEQDYLAWLFGQYTLSAVSTAIERNLAGKKARSKYVQEPMLQRYFENYKLTSEQICEREIEKAIVAELKYMSMTAKKGLPETMIK